MQWVAVVGRFGPPTELVAKLGARSLDPSHPTGMTNIRDCIPFPRTPKNADFLAGDSSGLLLRLQKETGR
jgi:hypothetical protein